MTRIHGLRGNQKSRSADPAMPWPAYGWRGQTRPPRRPPL